MISYWVLSQPSLKDETLKAFSEETRNSENKITLIFLDPNLNM